MAAPEMTVRVVAPGALREHPEQVAIYGAVGGAHDPDYGDLYESVRASGVRVPLIASEGTPGLPDGTVISGHRRLHAASELALAGVPVIFVAYESATHARLALLDCNRSREKDEWVRSQEATALWDIEAELAAQRKREGNAAGGRGGKSVELVPPTDTAKTRDAVAARMGESGKTTELRKKLVEKAREQNPEHPEESPAAQALKSGKAVKTVAREQGVLPAAKPRPARAPEPTVSIFDAQPSAPAPVAAATAREPVTCADIEAAVAFLSAHLITHPDAVADALDRVMQRLPSAQHARVLAAAMAREAA